ncbi:MAG TPA: DUF11 domain-containing protein, partial [Myxococcales bacterium]
MKHLASLLFAVGLLAVGPAARADTFATGSLIIPMDTTYQDAGMLKAYGLVYSLLSHGVPVRWVINPLKAYQGVDFTASATDLKTLAVVSSHGYRGGPFVIDSADAAAAIPIIRAWWTAVPTPLVTVHTATSAFSGSVAHYLIAAPKIAMHADGSQGIAISYLNAASIPDSQGNPWPSTSPDLLTPAQVAGPTTTNHCDGALFDSNCTPVYCQFMSMHWDLNAAAASPETVFEVRRFLSNPVHFFAECQAADAFENTVVAGQNGLPGHFLTTNGLVFGPQPASVDYYNPAETFAQIDGAFSTIGGSEPSYTLAPGSAYKAGGVVMLTGHGVAPGGGQDVWMTGFLDGACSPHQDTCGTLGKVSYLGGHQYTVATPISTNPKTQGVRMFLNSLFDSVCASSDGFPVLNLSLQAPSSTTSQTVTYTLSYANAGPSPALQAVLTILLPAGASFLSATNGGTFAAGTVTWNLGNLGAGQSGSASFTVSLGAYGTYSTAAWLAFHVGLNGFTHSSNTVSTLYVQCLGNGDCPFAKPICDAATHACRACQVDADCAATGYPICDLLSGSANRGACVVCTADSNCSSSDPRCNLSTNTCVACLTRADCANPAPVCSGSTKTCRACSSDADCFGPAPACQPSGACAECSSLNLALCTGSTPACDYPSGTCIGCRADLDCGGTTPACLASGACGRCSATSLALCVGSTPICDGATGTCIGCRSDADCGGAAPVCQGSGACGQCSASNPAACAGATPVCDPTSGTCLGCRTDADCGGAAPACQASGACAQCSPANPTACTGSTPACEPTSGTCIGCRTDADCGGATPACQAGGACGQCSATNSTACVGTTPLCGSASLCVACNGDDGTGASAACPSSAKPFCAADGSCGRCGYDSDCASGPHAGPYCSPASGACGATCWSDAECAPDGWCDDLATPGMGLCQPKVASGLPVPGGVCTAALGARTCLAGVCEASDGACGYLDGSGPCTAATAPTVCRSAVCATSGANAGLCEQCVDSTQCQASTPVCDTTADACVACKGDNGTGASEACPSSSAPYCMAGGACGRCGDDLDCALGSHAGPFCAPASGSCGAQCSSDVQCGPSSWCNDLATPATGLCQPKITNGLPVPGGACSAALGARSCVAGVCDTGDNACGHRNGEPCTVGGATVCRSAVCATSGPNAGLCEQCVDATTCSGKTPVCDAGSNRCVQCTGSAGQCSGTTPLCLATSQTCVACDSDFGSPAIAACPSSTSPFCAANGACGTCTSD